MDPRLLDYYNRELQYLREMGGEFARENPKVAARLSLDGFECQDPYVERLLEGFAFLSARVQLRLDAEFPRFTQHLIELLYPHYLCPTPSMAVVQMQPDLAEGGLAQGYLVERGTVMRSSIGKGDQTPCEYRVAHPTWLWPVQLEQAEYVGYFGDLAGIPGVDLSRVKAGIRFKLRATAGLTFDRIKMDALRVHLRGRGPTPVRLYEQLVGSAVAVVVRPVERPVTWMEVAPGSSIRQVGFEDDESLLPFVDRSFRGYRYLHEYFAFPERFLFVDIGGLSRGLRRCASSEVEVLVLFDRSDSVLENAIDAGDFALHATPAINLFPKRADRIHLDAKNHEYHVVPDRTRPFDFEVFRVEGVKGHGTVADDEVEFLPFYAHTDGNRYGEVQAYFSVNRAPRMLSSKQKRSGPRSSYIGSEVWVALVDGKEAPYRSELKQLSVRTLCTNRDLPLHMPLGQGTTDFSLDSGAPVKAIRVLSGPSKPRPARYGGELIWRFLSHLSLNYLSLANTPGQGAASLRDLLALYVDLGEPHTRKQIDGVRSIESRSVTRRIPSMGPISFGRGLEIGLQLDESAFEGSGVFLLGAVLDRFFAKYVSINSFTETVVKTTDRGEIVRWPIRTGQRALL
ncbi:MAG: type VI secretion system baseplate subunit TssF [Candidatus Eisenbacteria bacterium]|uniref:Type VI secretion system baseplate subunit TssF n=1 Tax=Eiseniibacteriota bacterium TaxID=2212470 RepID=A0A956NEE9_UNCEI|nr:type VI secretion system baseplate subunit TssF [Candidatus Eisenbacteria bacterium]MCB9463355.1 type VI secretion system baseplate subunit TssF [Candidatus Eisenbacteria bacterium]